MTGRNQAPVGPAGVPSGNRTFVMKRGITLVCAFCALMGYLIVVAPPALAESKSTPAALKNWYQQSGRHVQGNLYADAERFAHVKSSTSASVEKQDCKDFRNDVTSAASGKPPPESVLAQDYRYFLLAAAKSFQECMRGVASNDGVQVLAGTQVGARAAAAAIKIILGTEAGHTVAVPPSSVSLTPSIPASVLVPQCESDFKVLEVATAAYNAQNNKNAVPPAAWSASTYAQNFAPLQNAKNGGPFMSGAFDTTDYVLEYDATGNVWVEPPGQYDTSYNAAHGSTQACAAVVK